MQNNSNQYIKEANQGDNRMTEQKKKHRLSVVSRLHYLRLIYRSALFLAALISYILYHMRGHGSFTEEFEKRPFILLLIWIVYFVEMVFRFIPSKFESPGSQKQFKRNYIRTGRTEIDIHDNNGTVLVALIWICFNALFGVLHMLGVIDDGFLILLCCAYAVCDMICILFFCPFQTWFLRNKCCSSCRIYNWDYAMMFTPLFFIRNWYGWSLLGLSVILLLRWEITFFLHPERFTETTNAYVSCANCTEKLCRHKTQLQSLWKNIESAQKERFQKLKG